MKPDVKKNWVEALRSGDYKQGVGRLHTRDAEGQHHYCCLGVLCDILNVPAEEEGPSFSDEFSVATAAMRYNYLGCSGVLPSQIKDEVDLQSPMTGILADMNDSGETFAQIADFIEEKL